MKPENNSDSSWVATKSVWLPFIAFFLAVVLAVSLAIYFSYSSHKEKEGARLQAIAQLKISILAKWLSDIERDSQFLKSNQLLSAELSNWSPGQSNESRERVVHCMG